MTLKLFMYSLARPSAGPGDRERCTESEASSEARVGRTWRAAVYTVPYLYSIRYKERAWRACVCNLIINTWTNVCVCVCVYYSTRLLYPFTFVSVFLLLP